MPARARLETQAPPGRRSLSSPTKARRRSGAESTLPGSTARRRLHTRPRLCKRCAVLVRRRNSACSLRFVPAEFLEARIVSQRVPERIEAKNGGRDRIGGRDFKQVRQGGNRGVDLAEARLDLGQRCFRDWFREGIVSERGDGGAGGIERALLISK